MTTFELSNNQIIYAVCFSLFTLFCIYFLLIWQIREISKEEIQKDKEISEEHKKNLRKKKLLQLKQKKLYQLNQQVLDQKNQSMENFDGASSNMSNFTDELDGDLDSYIDPAVGYNNRQNENGELINNNSGYSGNRLDKNDIMARDIADGFN